ncbi:VanZ family protein [Paraprevotella xylaniphila]|uniref:VanZ-like protein n=1 Tax=Paraprevotella xylaniphila YIT 11841 TaxID=762982 RepID=F3QX49_9BACT|nr:VanZ family protein [Paraprevotella xylaniphila]EGG51499.1 VanZ-like protein [Paraprevotella xylaniphila YIT 11841]
MTHELTKWIRRHPISVILILVIWYLSLFTPPKTELANVRFIDKWAHLLMYGSLAFVLWMEDWRVRKASPSMPCALALYIGPVAMSGLIELAQAYCTTDRSGDWLDLAANAIGALAGIVLSGMLTRKMRKKA